jgi:hypothetical protein
MTVRVGAGLSIYRMITYDRKGGSWVKYLWNDHLWQWGWELGWVESAGRAWGTAHGVLRPRCSARHRPPPGGQKENYQARFNPVQSCVLAQQCLPVHYQPHHNYKIYAYLSLYLMVVFLSLLSRQPVRWDSPARTINAEMKTMRMSVCASICQNKYP